MILPPRSQFGPYTVLDLIGSGASGEVYRARDPKLGREIALKVMGRGLSAHADRLAFFEHEGRLLASLNHPHIGAVYGYCEADGIIALALELVEGETLAARLRRGRLPDAEAVRYAIQLTDALAYAHRSGVIHRDVKPTNIVVTPQGAKLVDFGLACVAQSAGAAATLDAGSWQAEAGPAGTPFYMSPEQNAGLEPDHRTDIYAVGLVMCQMLTGFVPDNVSGISTRTLIRGLLDQIASRPLRLVVERCLASDPDERWLHAGDLRHALAAVSEPPVGDGGSERDSSSVPLHLFAHGRRPRSRARLAAGVLAAVATASVALTLVYIAGRYAAVADPPQHQQLTFRRGTVLTARFAGGNSIVYSAAWDSRPAELWSLRPESPESRPLGIPGARVLAVSASGEMAVLLGYLTGAGGMLARLALDATVPREVLAGVDAADWSPDGQSLAVSHVVDGKVRLEFPIGNVLYENSGWIDGVRVSPDGRSVAFIDHPLFYDDRGLVSIVPAAGGMPRVLSAGPWTSVTGLAWSPRGDEIWFTASEFGLTRRLYAVDLAGRLRLLSESANQIIIQDIDGSGRVLVTEGRYRLRISAADAAGANERDLSWLDGSVLTDLSLDGSTMMINEMGAGAGTPLHAVYLRNTDGSSAVRLGEGISPVLAPDGQWVAAVRLDPPGSLVLLPTGAGPPRTLERGPIADYQMAAWFPDGRRLLIAASVADRPPQLWTQDVSGGPPAPIGPEGFRLGVYSRPISPDGQRAIAVDVGGRAWVFPLGGPGQPMLVPSLKPNDLPIRWAADGQSVYFFSRGQLPGPVGRVYLADGRVEQVATLAPADAAGVRQLLAVQTTPDARRFVYGYVQDLSDLFLVTNLR